MDQQYHVLQSNSIHLLWKFMILKNSGRTEKGLGAQCVYTTNIIKSGAQGDEQAKWTRRNNRVPPPPTILTYSQGITLINYRSWTPTYRLINLNCRLIFTQQEVLRLIEHTLQKEEEFHNPSLHCDVRRTWFITNACCKRILLKGTFKELAHE